MTEPNETTPGGVIPPEEDGPLVAQIARVGRFLKENWLVFPSMAIFAALMWMFRNGWSTLFTVLMFSIALGLSVWLSQSSGEEETGRFKRWAMSHPRRTVLVFLILPFFVFPVINGYEAAVDFNYERQFDPPKLYVIYNVAEDNFTDEQQDKLERWDPSPKNRDGEGLRRTLLLAAYVAGIHADEVELFDPTDLEPGDKVTAVVFENVTETITTIPPMDMNGDGTPPKPIVSKKAHMVLYFFSDVDVHKMVQEAQKREPRELDEVAQDDNVVAVLVPENLDLNFDLFAGGFARASGKPLNFQLLNKLREQLEEDGVIIDGTRG